MENIDTAEDIVINKFSNIGTFEQQFKIAR
jgi:hypothetical protein